jgi:hypothetical protein
MPYCKLHVYLIKKKDTQTVLRSRNRKVGVGAVTRCGSGSASDGSGSDNGINLGWEFKMTQNVTVYNPFSSYFQQYKSYRIK